VTFNPFATADSDTYGKSSTATYAVNDKIFRQRAFFRRLYWNCQNTESYYIKLILYLFIRILY